MGIYLPAVNEFGWRLSSQAGTRPATNYGHTVTPGNNTKGSWLQIFTGAQIANEVYWIWVCINSGNTSAAAKDMIVDIGIDPAGGTAYTVLLPDLLCGMSNNMTDGPFFYNFPIRIPAGSSVAARASVNNATVGTVRVWLKVFGLPSRPDLIKVGHVCSAYGIVAASSRGTLHTPGTTAEGAWTSLGTTSHRNWWWQIGCAINDATITAAAVWFIDLSYGDATNKHIIIEDSTSLEVSSSERLGFGVHSPAACYSAVPSGQELFIRSQYSVALDSNFSAAAYGVSF